MKSRLCETGGFTHEKSIKDFSLALIEAEVKGVLEQITRMNPLMEVSEPGKRFKVRF